jgi:hypothetical protein
MDPPYVAEGGIGCPGKASAVSGFPSPTRQTTRSSPTGCDDSRVAIPIGAKDNVAFTAYRSGNRCDRRGRADRSADHQACQEADQHTNRFQVHTPPSCTQSRPPWVRFHPAHAMYRVCGNPLWRAEPPTRSTETRQKCSLRTLTVGGSRRMTGIVRGDDGYPGKPSASVMCLSLRGAAWGGKGIAGNLTSDHII